MEFENKFLVIRADANARMGTGHLMRCLALAQAWQAQGGQTIFVTVCESAALRQRLSDEGFRVITLERPYPDPTDWEITSETISAYSGAWMVLDGYHFDSVYQIRIKEAGHPLLVIDDMAHLEHYYADVLLNQNIHAERLDYSCEPYTRLLLGTEYVLLRREFWPWRGRRRQIPPVARKVLVTLGGSDPDNQTLNVIRVLQQVNVNDLEAVVVVGASNPHYRELEAAVRHSPLPIRLLRNVTNMPELMDWADVAISTGGSTCWELAFMGLPSILLVLAENQQNIPSGLDEEGIAFNLGWFEQVEDIYISKALSNLSNDRERRQQMSRNGQALVDGTGGERLVLTLVAQA